jgi:hypothetical protein
MARRPRATTIREEADHSQERKGAPMKRFGALSLLIAGIALAAVLAGTALAAHTVAFKGSYVGKVTEKVDGQAVTALASGAGSGTVVGKGRLTGTVTSTTANPPCSPLNGPGTISGPAGKLKLTVVSTTSRGCAASEEDQDSINIAGNAKVNGGTLKYKQARGTLHFSGHYDRKSGSFNVKLTGKFTY